MTAQVEASGFTGQQPRAVRKALVMHQEPVRDQ